MRFNFYNGLYGNELNCDMEGFILQYENQENLTLKFPLDSPVMLGDNFVPKGNFSVIPPDGVVKCNNISIEFQPLYFAGLPEEPVVSISNVLRVKSTIKLFNDNFDYPLQS